MLSSKTKRHQVNQAWAGKAKAAPSLGWNLSSGRSAFARFVSLSRLQGHRGHGQRVERWAVVRERGSDQRRHVQRTHPTSGAPQPWRGDDHRLTARSVLENCPGLNRGWLLHLLMCHPFCYFCAQLTSWPMLPGGRAVCHRRGWSEPAVTWIQSDLVTFWTSTWTPTSRPGSSGSCRITKVRQRETNLTFPQSFYSTSSLIPPWPIVLLTAALSMLTQRVELLLRTTRSLSSLVPKWCQRWARVRLCPAVPVMSNTRLSLGGQSDIASGSSSTKPVLDRYWPEWSRKWLSEKC